MIRRQATKPNKFKYYMSKPIDVLRKARDLYVKGMLDCASKLGDHGVGIGCPAAQVIVSLPRSFSVDNSKMSYDDDDDRVRDLLEKVSRRKKKSKLAGDQARNPNPSRRSHRESGGLWRSYSTSVAGLGRIDEDKPCYFEEDDHVLYPRTRSYAPKTSNFAYQYN